MIIFNIISETFAFKLRVNLFQGMLKQDLPFFDNKDNSIDNLLRMLQVEVKSVQEVNIFSNQLVFSLSQNL